MSMSYTEKTHSAFHARRLTRPTPRRWHGSSAVTGWR